jgi:hypothetical protein
MTSSRLLCRYMGHFLSKVVTLNQAPVVALSSIAARYDGRCQRKGVFRHAMLRSLPYPKEVVN